jgi:hypothetical protein
MCIVCLAFRIFLTIAFECSPFLWLIIDLIDCFIAVSAWRNASRTTRRNLLGQEKRLESDGSKINYRFMPKSYGYAKREMWWLENRADVLQNRILTRLVGEWNCEWAKVKKDFQTWYSTEYLIYRSMLYIHSLASDCVSVSLWGIERRYTIDSTTQLEKFVRGRQAVRFKWNILSSLSGALLRMTILQHCQDSIRFDHSNEFLGIDKLCLNKFIYVIKSNRFNSIQFDSVSIRRKEMLFRHDKSNNSVIDN